MQNYSSDDFSECGQFLYLENWLPIIHPKIPTRNASLKVKIPKEYKIHFTDQLIDYFKIDTSDLSLNYTWLASYKDVSETELFSPSIYNFLPTVVIVPQEFKYELKGSFNSWTTYGNWQYALNQGLSDLPLSEKNKISTLVEGVEGEKEKIKKLYHYLQDETRYINIAIGTGGMKPYPASYVVKNKYGNEIIIKTLPFSIPQFELNPKYPLYYFKYLFFYLLYK